MKKMKNIPYAICAAMFVVLVCRYLTPHPVTAADGAAACSRWSYQAVTTFSAGLSNPFNILAGDYNGDDLDDLAVFGSNKNVVLLGDGTGKFGATGILTMPLTLTQAVSGDFNGDAISDLAGINILGGDAQVGLMLGDGVGNFSKSVALATDQPRHSIAGDFNSDGELDLVVTSATAKSITLYPGDGKGQFGQAIVTRVEKNPSFLAGGDFNGDGKLDLAVSNELSDSVSIMANDGTGRFSVLNDFPVEYGPGEMVSGDFNRDGKPDLAVRKTRPQQLFIFLNSGGGQFLKTGSFDATDNSRIFALDFNHDNALDLALTLQPSGGILLNNGGGAFTATPMSSLPGTFAAGDFNLDGRIDLAACAQEIEFGGRIYVYLGDETGRFRTAANVNLNSSNFASGVGIGDFNRDGNPDLAIANYNAFGGQGNVVGPVSILLGDGTGGFRLITNITVGSAPRRVVVHDFNGDGKDDLAVTLAGESKVALLIGDGSGFFGISGKYNTGSDTMSMVTGDFNGDGKTDLVANGRNTGIVTMMLGDGMGFSSLMNYPAGDSPLWMATGDFNRDGKLDLAVSSGAGTKITILPGDGAGHFGAGSSFTAGVKTGPLASADFNHDGKADLAVTNEILQNRGKVVIFLGDGTGQFNAAGDYELDDIPIDLTTADVNGDGRPDLVVANQLTTGATVLLNDGAGGFTGKASYPSISNPSSIAVADLNKDGGPDLIVPTVFGSASIVFSACQTTPQLVSASAASFRSAKLATESIVAAFGAALSSSTEVAGSLPLPTSLGGASVSVKDSLGAERPAPLFFVSPLQINYQIPPGTAEGPATVTIKNGTAVAASGQAQISKVAPGLFTANSDGVGVAAASVLRAKADGSQIYEPMLRFDPTANKFVPAPIDLGPDSDQVFLLLYGAGLRFSASPQTSIARVGGERAEIFYLGAQGGFVGLDQVNLLLPRTLAGRGEVDVFVTVNGKTTNLVKVSVK
jgi:uncharacterized protein (TIGR03437 family)